jgi:hypothetical protein
MNRGHAWLLRGGFLCAPLFVCSLLVFGSLAPGFSHYTQAVSRLGAWDLRFGLWFSFFGLLLPGVLASGVAWGLRRSLLEAGLPTRWGSGLLLYTVLIALTAIPADFTLMFNSPWTWAHAFFVLANPLVLFVVIPGCAGSLRRLGVSRFETRVFVVLGYLPLLEFPLYLVTFPGLVQRVMIVTAHLGIAWLAWILLRLAREAASAARLHEKQITSQGAHKEAVARCRCKFQRRI